MAFYEKLKWEVSNLVRYYCLSLILHIVSYQILKQFYFIDNSKVGMSIGQSKSKTPSFN